MIPTFQWNSVGITVAGTVGIPGTMANQLYGPMGLALDSSNTLYVADWYNNRVQAWLLGASTGMTVAGDASGTPGSDSNYLNTPADVAVDSNGNIYVADTYNHRVQFWARDASTGTTIAGTGSPGTSNNELTYPQGIARDSSSGTLYIADTFNHRVMRYLPNTLSGTVVAGGNDQGLGNTQLFYPYSICFDLSSNSLVISNWAANNVVRWVLGATSWTLVAGDISGSSGSTSTLFDQPFDITLDSWGNLYVADSHNYRIQFFLAGQSNSTTIAGFTGIPGDNATLLYVPSSVILDDQLNLYVADTFNHRIQKFQHY
ncbi:unnamed protein product [Rotaria sp. Silwood1]|nr:unnamed protein product [Rotaria sp. Silwood1]